MALHHIEPERTTLHGRFSPDLPPVLTVDSGDTVRYRTLDVSWGMEQHGAPGTPRRKFEPRRRDRDDGPALCGPVAVRGAEPGMTLAIHIEAVEPASWGWTWAGATPFNVALRAALGMAETPDALIRWQLDADAKVGVSEHGHVVALRPFLGTIGMPPAEPGLHSGWSPRVTGGNMDCKELVAGATLYLPVAVPGGLVSLGDGHAVQGDGEAGGTAIECPMERVDIRYVVHDDLPVGVPRIHTPAAWGTLGFGATLEAASVMALGEMLVLMQDAYAMPRNEALALAGVTVDLRITQLVNGVVGVHALLSHDAVHEEKGGKSGS